MLITSRRMSEPDTMKLKGEDTMTTTRARYMCAALVAVVISIVLLAGAERQTWAGSPVVVEGVGTFNSVVVRTTIPMDPSCVSLVTRVGTVEFDGFVTNAAADSTFLSHTVRDACASPIQGPTKQTDELLNATVAGRTGHLTVEAEGVFEGDATVAPGARSRYHLTITGVDGDFQGAYGEGQSVGLATTTSSSNSYYVKIWLKK
jgi:hypothetical protein